MMRCALRAVLIRTLCTMLVTCLLSGIPAWAGLVGPGTLLFSSNPLAPPQGLLSLNPGIGNDLTIGGFGMGGLIDTFTTGGPLCIAGCAVIGGYVMLTSGPELSGVIGGTGPLYTFGAGGMLDIIGAVPALGITFPQLLFSAGFLSGSTLTIDTSGLTVAGTFNGVLDPASMIINPALGSYAFVSGVSIESSSNLGASCATLGGACAGLVDPIVQVQTPTPEPGTLSLITAGLFTFGARLLRRRTPRIP